MAEGGDSGFLPPEPAGPEPDLGDRGQDPTQPLHPTAQTQPLPQQQYAPPQYPPPQYPPQQHYPPPQPQPWQQAPYGYGPPPGYGYGPPPGWQQPSPGWTGVAREPDNNKAVAGFVLSLVTAFLWLTFLGFPVLGIGLAVAGVVYSRKGKREVEEGRTTKNKGLAQAGWIVGIVMIFLTVLSTLGWIAFIIAVATDESFRDDLDNSSGTIAIGLVKGILGLFT